MSDCLIEQGLTSAEWVSEQCLTSPPTQYRLYGRRFLQVKRPNQQYQSTEGESCKGKQHKKHKENRKYTHTQNSIQITVTQTNTASPLVYNNMGWLGGQLPQRAGSLGLNGGGTAVAVPPSFAIAQLWASECLDVKKTNDGLTQSGTGCFIAVPMWKQWASKG